MLIKDFILNFSNIKNTFKKREGFKERIEKTTFFSNFLWGSSVIFTPFILLGLSLSLKNKFMLNLPNELILIICFFPVFLFVFIKKIYDKQYFEYFKNEDSFFKYISKQHLTLKNINKGKLIKKEINDSFKNEEKIYYKEIIELKENLYEEYMKKCPNLEGETDEFKNRITKEYKEKFTFNLSSILINFIKNSKKQEIKEIKSEIISVITKEFEEKDQILITNILKKRASREDSLTENIQGNINEIETLLKEESNVNIKNNIVKQI